MDAGKIFVKIVELKIISVIVMIVVGVVAVLLLWRANGNSAAMTGGYVCLGLFGLLAMFLTVYSITKEHFETILLNERKSSQAVASGWKSLASESRRTATALEGQRRESATQVPVTQSKIFEKYTESGQDQGTGTQ